VARQQAETLQPEVEAEPTAAAEVRVEAVAPAVEPEKAAPEAQAPAEGEAPARYRLREDVLLDEIEPAQLPVLEGEPEGDSIGWVQGQLPEEFFDWAAQEQPEDLAWLRDEGEVEEVEEVRTSKKNKDKRRGRQERPDADLEALMRRPRKRGRTHGR
jgi:hypothetical protein